MNEQEAYLVRTKFEDGQYSDFEYYADNAHDAIVQHISRKIEYGDDLHPALSENPKLKVTDMHSWIYRRNGKRLATFGLVGTNRHYGPSSKGVRAERV